MFYNSLKLKKELEELKNENENIKINANTLLVTILNDLDILKEKYKMLKQKNIILQEENKNLLLNNNNLQENKIKIPKYIQNIIKEFYLNSSLIYDCPLCFEDINSENLIISDCGHYYCSNCLIKLDKCLTCNYNFTYKNN
jgi:hypothetical protein